MRPVDRPLDHDIVATVVYHQFPEVDVREVTKIGEGWQYEVFDVDGWMFRFPRYAEVLPWLEREVAFMPIVAEAMDVAVPRFEKLGRPTEAFPYAFVGYRRIPGVAADESPVCNLERLATQIGTAYGQLHAIDGTHITPTPAGWENETWEDWRTFDAEDAADIEAALPSRIVRLAAPYLAGDVPPPPFDDTRVVVHNDIGADHVLVDPATGSLTGLLDFSDLIVGDPAIDFPGLITISDEAFVHEVLRHYPHDVDETFVERVTWATRILTLVWVAEMFEDDQETSAKHLLWVERAFANA